MADDIDDLLDQVEDDLRLGKSQSQTRSQREVISKKAPSPRPSKSQQKTRTNNSDKCKHENDLDAMIDDIFDDSDHAVSSNSSLTKTASSSSCSSMTGSKGQKKCFPVFLGGSLCAQGLATTVNQRVCDRLRCTDCDFDVSTFDNFKWHATTDYLFLRNNMPDFERLKSKLAPKKGYRAYACQCQSRSIRDLTQLQSEPELKWVCGKH